MDELEKALRIPDAKPFVHKVQRNKLDYTDALANFRLYGPAIHLEASKLLFTEADGRRSKIVAVPSRIEVQEARSWHSYPVFAYLDDPCGLALGFAVCGVDAFHLFLGGHNIDLKLLRQVEYHGLLIERVKRFID
jgi:hypothetical protein